MSPNQAPTEALKDRSHRWKVFVLRSAGIGGGFAVVATLLLGGIIWWSNKPKPWSATSVTAKATYLTTQLVGEEL